VDVLDEAGFGEEGLDFRIAGEEVKVADEVEQALFARAEVRGGDEVGADAVTEGAGFADVNDDAAGVFHEIDAGAFGELFGFFAEARDALVGRLCGGLERDVVAGLLVDRLGLEGIGRIRGGLGDVGAQGTIGGEILGGEVVVGVLFRRIHGMIIA
jgi:hypothetical protein